MLPKLFSAIGEAGLILSAFLKYLSPSSIFSNSFKTDPKLVKNAKKINKISYEEMLEMASLGAKVMQPASIQEARLNRIEIDVRSTFSKTVGTTITKKKNIFFTLHKIYLLLLPPLPLLPPYELLLLLIPLLLLL